MGESRGRVDRGTTKWSWAWISPWKMTVWYIQLDIQPSLILLFLGWQEKTLPCILHVYYKFKNDKSFKYWHRDVVHHKRYASRREKGLRWKIQMICYGDLNTLWRAYTIKRRVFTGVIGARSFTSPPLMSVYLAVHGLLAWGRAGLPQCVVARNGAPLARCSFEAHIELENRLQFEVH